MLLTVDEHLAFQYSVAQFINTALIIYRIAVVSLLLGALGVCSRWSCAVGAIAFYYWTGLAYSFGKPHHDKVALAFSLAALPFALCEVSPCRLTSGVERAVELA